MLSLPNRTKDIGTHLHALSPSNLFTIPDIYISSATKIIIKIYMYFSKQTSPKGNNAPEGRTFLAKKTNYPYHKPFLNFPKIK